jgi:hypothetical protein
MNKNASNANHRIIAFMANRIIVIMRGARRVNAMQQRDMDLRTGRRLLRASSRYDFNRNSPVRMRRFFSRHVPVRATLCRSRGSAEKSHNLQLRQPVSELDLSDGRSMGLCAQTY